MTLKQLKYLIAVVENGFNITAAAERLYTSQPGISKQLRQLEDEVGVQIFARKNKNLTGVTPAGQTIVDYARGVLLNVDNIKNVGRELLVEQEGTLSIATTHTQARYILPATISAFHERYPKVALELHQGTSEQIADLVAANGVDFAIATESRELFPDLNLLPGFSWDRVALVPKNHALANSREPLTLARLAEYPLITYVLSSHRPSSFLDAFENDNLDPNVVFTARDADVIKTYVRLGMGVGVIAPMALLCTDLDDLHAIDARGLFRRVTTWLGIKRDRALRGYMLDFIALFAPHWSRDSIELAAAATSQQDVDVVAAEIDVPLFTGCSEDVSDAA